MYIILYIFTPVLINLNNSSIHLMRLEVAAGVMRKWQQGTIRSGRCDTANAGILNGMRNTIRNAFQTHGQYDDRRQ